MISKNQPTSVSPYELRRFCWIQGERIGLIALIIALLLTLATPGRAAYTEADIRAIRFNETKATEMGDPAVLLAHLTEISMSGNGPRETFDQLLWYVADPSDPKCESISNPQIPIEATTETFGLNHCLIYRGQETITVNPDLWHLALPDGWPEDERDPWRVATAQLPALEAGDIVDIAYKVMNPWKRAHYPSDWEVVALTNPNAPTIERNIKIKYNSVKTGFIKVIGDDCRPIRHRGTTEPMWEILTGNLPTGPAEPVGLNAPRVYFTTNTDWDSITTAVKHSFGSGMIYGERAYGELGSKLALESKKAKKRLEKIYRHLNNNWEKIEEPLLASNYYPRSIRELQHTETTKPMDRALLFGSIASAASIQTDFFLARSSKIGFVSDFHSPMQFDQILLRVYLIDENRHIFLDPWAKDLKAGENEVVEGSYLIGMGELWSGLYSLGENASIQEAQ